jgi:hypothetical protein
MPQLIFSLIVLLVLLTCIVISSECTSQRYRRMLKITGVKNKDRKPHEAPNYVRLYGIEVIGLDCRDERILPLLFTPDEIYTAAERARKQPEDALLKP